MRRDFCCGGLIVADVECSGVFGYGAVDVLHGVLERLVAPPQREFPQLQWQGGVGARFDGRTGEVAVA